MLHMADSMRHATTLALLLAACGTQPPAASPDAEDAVVFAGGASVPMASDDSTAKPWRSRRQQPAVLEWHLSRKEVGEHFAGDSSTFLNCEVAGGQIDMQTCGR